MDRPPSPAQNNGHGVCHWHCIACIHACSQPASQPASQPNSWPGVVDVASWTGRSASSPANIYCNTTTQLCFLLPAPPLAVGHMSSTAVNTRLLRCSASSIWRSGNMMRPRDPRQLHVATGNLLGLLLLLPYTALLPRCAHQSSANTFDSFPIHSFINHLPPSSTLDQALSIPPEAKCRTTCPPQTRLSDSVGLAPFLSHGYGTCTTRRSQTASRFYQLSDWLPDAHLGGRIA